MKAAPAAVLIATLLMTGVCAVRADEFTDTLAQAGHWTAAAHMPSMASSPDICVAHSDQGLVFRHGEDGVEVRMTDDDWSLPSGVTGQIVLQVGAAHHSFTVFANDINRVTAHVPPDEVGPLLDQIAAAPTLAVSVGSAVPIIVDLEGSKVVLAAFRTCSHIGGGDGGGENPFAK